MSAPLSERALERLLALASEGESELPPQAPAATGIGERYEIVHELGRGGMGVVYEAVDRHLGRRCALKVIHGVFGGGEELRGRLVREALAAARLRHPHIAAVYDATPDYISMQLIAGSSIGTIPRSERRLLVELLRDAARAVHHAHEQGIVHRDLKPSNLLVEGRHVFVVDFGLAKEISVEGARTLSGMIVGTPAFMAPEQARGRTAEIDARTDVYGLGATLHACLAGRPPFEGGELVGLLQRVVEEAPKAAGIDRDLDLVLLKCLEKDPAQRYASASELADDLDRWLRDEPVLARRPSLGYRLSKLLQRRKTLVRASLFAALGAVVVTALILGPIAWRERDARVRQSAAAEAAREAVLLMDETRVMLEDAAVFTRLGDLPSAHETLDAAIARTRAFLARHEVARVRYLLSRLLRARGQEDLALAELDLAIAVEPGLTEARFERGLMQARQQTLDEPERGAVIADLASGLGDGSALTSIDLLYGRGELARAQGNLHEAAELLEEVLAYDSAHVGARRALAYVSLALGDQELAWHYSISAVDLQQGFGPVYHARESRLLPTSILGLDGALVDFSSALADGPDNSVALARRGIVNLRRALRLAAEGRAEDARNAVRSAIEDHDATLVLHPEVAGALNNRAVCHMQAERLFAAGGDSAAAAQARALAEADLARALARDPALPEAHFNSGVFSARSADLLRKLGNGGAASRRADLARESLQQALALAPSDWPHRRACQARLAEVGAASRGND